ncbi:hypothetical protein PtA15_2A520 [Puccinia triticina]|uniref:Uncharacterized protein n=1 Tax=Puccinia triticina TaxID=208348 RepID=A0ABY7CBB0_9BASI|nr:uncharacterized protein PtA15_2A520 [Puccinia triticina]WAQ82203.1 hypothetical protein PtA15_2A520 [Puccinia triticina]WAR53060.1 hypothetical protein PtB15_2B489 [Puccinia triticina]
MASSFLFSLQPSHANPNMHSTNTNTNTRQREHPVPVSAKAPIPSFYENLNGRWVLSDNWNLYGLSGSSQRHRPRSLDQAPSQPPSTPSLVHHASALNGTPASLQYDAAPLNSSSTTTPANTTASQKLYLPAGWNHTSKRGPLYATSVIVVASLLIAVAVLSTVVCLVARRRARGRRKTQLKEGLLDPAAAHSPADHHPSHSHPTSTSSKLSPAEIEEGRGLQAKQLKHRLVPRKLSQLTLVKVFRSPRGKTQARISRISILPSSKPNEPPPPSLIVVGEARRSASFNSTSSFRCTGDALARRRTHSHRTESQSDETAEPNHQTLNGLLSVPIHRNPSSTVSTFTPAQFPTLPPPESSPAGGGSSSGAQTIRAVESVAELADERPPADDLLSRTYSTTMSEPSPRRRRTRSDQRRGQQRAEDERPAWPIPTDPTWAAAGRQTEPGRASVDPNYRSCREIIRARSSTSSSSHRGPPVLASSSPASLPDLHFSIPPLPPSSGSRPSLAHHDAPHLPGTDPSGEPLPPASRMAEKQRMSAELAGPPDAPDPRPRREPDQEPEDAIDRAPFVAHVATDDKLVLKSLLRMGSTPAMGSRSTPGDKALAAEHEQSPGDSRRPSLALPGLLERSTPTTATGSGVERPSAPPLVAEGDDDPFALDEKPRLHPPHPQDPMDDGLVGQSTDLTGFTVSSIVPPYVE